MKSECGVGVHPRRGRGATAAVAVVLCAVSAAGPQAHAAKARSIDFRGELNYETFKRAASKGVGVRIRHSPGGTGAAAMALGRTRGLVIDGTCNSACAWAFVQNANACFTRRASFGFHGAHDPGTGRRLAAATDYWLSTVRPALRPRLARLRTSSGIVRVGASEMARYYGDRVCATATSATEAPAVTALSAAESRAAVEALRQAAFQDGIVTASLLYARTGSVREAAGGDTASCLVCTVMPTLPPEFQPTAGTVALPGTILWGGVLASAVDATSTVKLAASELSSKRM